MCAVAVTQRMRMETDEQLLTAFQKGDPAAFEALDRRYRPRLTAYVTRRLAPDLQEAVDDIVQKTLQYLFTRAAVLTRPNTVVQSVLFKQAFRCMKDHWKNIYARCRDRARTKPLPSSKDTRYDTPPGRHPAPPASTLDTSCYCDVVDKRGAEKLAARQEVAEYMGMLSPAEAEIIRLMDLANHTAKSAAKILHINLSTAQWRYRKAHAHLRQIAQNTQNERAA